MYPETLTFRSLTRGRGALVLLVASGLVSSPARAVPPPAMPLPPCVDAEGFRSGACPTESPDVLGTSVGRLSFNASVGAYVDPQIPACNTWDKNGTGLWTPSPCYVAVDAIKVVGCAYIAVGTGGFREESNCARALFAPGASASGDLFKVVSGPGGTCGGAGAFWTYFYGGPADQPAKIWAAKGPNSTKCQVDYLGPKPDGLLGPTWVKLRASIDRVEGVTTSDSGSARTTEFYVPIDGELRDLGPVAAFHDAFNAGGKVRFANDSLHTHGESMTYRWDFGDGATSTATAPEHRYAEPGVYRVTLVATDASGDEAKATASVQVRFLLGVEVSYDPPVPKVGDTVNVTVTVTNAFLEPVSKVSLIGPNGLRLDAAHLVQNAGPLPAEPPPILAAGEVATFRFEVEPIAAGPTVIEAGAIGFLGDTDVSSTAQAAIRVPARLELALATTVKSTTKVGDEFTVTATVTNADEVEIGDIKSEPLETRPLDIVDHVSGPTTADGADPRVAPLTLAPGASTTLSWTYRASGRGPVDLRALVSARDPHSDSLMVVSGSKRIAIESGGIEVRDLRLSPGSPTPGSFGVIRGTVENIGSLDVTDLDFAISGEPSTRQIERLIRELDPAVAPRIAKLEKGKSQDFVIPVGMSPLADDLQRYRGEVTMTGTVDLDGVPTEVSHTATFNGGLDLTQYWTTFLEEFKRDVWEDFLQSVDGYNDWGDASTIGGSVVGGGQGVLDALQKTGDGLIGTGELVFKSVTGQYHLTDKGQALAQLAVEYYRTRSLKRMAVDLADAEIAVNSAVVGQFGGWLQKIDKAVSSGDARETARILAESGTTLAISAGGEQAVEQVGARIWRSLVTNKVARETLEAVSSGAGPVEANVDLPDGELRLLEIDDIRDLPTGVNLSAATVAKAGINPRELSWMQRVAKKRGVAFFARPRPAAAARFAEAGMNAKPVRIKFKSLSDLDVRWLGYDDFAGSEGLVVLREPKNPWDEILDAVESGELTPDSNNEIKAIMARYEKRKAEWKSVKQTLDDLNAENGGEGFEVLYKGKKVKTKAYLDADGRLRFSHNNEAVYSDNDILHLGRPDGKHIDKETYYEIINAAESGIDMQHGATFNTGDFPSWEKAIQFVDEYGGEHMRITPSGARGEPLIIIGPDATTAGYVKTIEYPAAAPGAGSDLFGLVNATFEGAGFP